MMLVRLGRNAEVIKVLEPYAVGDDMDPETLPWLAYAYARVGKTTEARAMLGRLEDRARRQNIAPAHCVATRVFSGCTPRTLLLAAASADEA
jgi:Flp pilus assembly protein TadD